MWDISSLELLHTKEVMTPISGYTQFAARKQYIYPNNCWFWDSLRLVTRENNGADSYLHEVSVS